MESNKKPKKRRIGVDTAQHRKELFDRYVMPHLNLVYKLCIDYSHSQMDIEDNYNEVLINFYKYIETYDPARPIQAWLHIVTKRFINDLNQRRSLFKKTEDVSVYEIPEDYINETEVSDSCMDTTNYTQMYNDDILKALDQLKPIYKEALLLQMAGYKLNEIMEISYRKGEIKTKNIETIKSRLFLAKYHMRKLINRDGETREDQ